MAVYVLTNDQNRAENVSIEIVNYPFGRKIERKRCRFLSYSYFHVHTRLWSKSNASEIRVDSDISAQMNASKDEPNKRRRIQGCNVLKTVSQRDRNRVSMSIVVTMIGKMSVDVDKDGGG